MAKTIRRPKAKKAEKKKTIYLIPGLGADGTIFQKLTFPTGYDIVHIEWIKPHNKESVPEYAERLVEQIDPKAEATLIGLSFGGMVAIELAKHIKPARTIIISSAKTRRDTSVGFSLVSWTRPYRFITSLLAIKFGFWYPMVFGKLTKEEKEWVREMAEGIDPDFTDWATDSALQWDNEELIPNLAHIHGTCDNLFPHFYIRESYHRVEGGTHFMVATKAGEVSDLIHQELTGKRMPVRKAG